MVASAAHESPSATYSRTGCLTTGGFAPAGTAMVTAAAAKVTVRHAVVRIDPPGQKGGRSAARMIAKNSLTHSEARRALNPADRHGNFAPFARKSPAGQPFSANP